MYDVKRVPSVVTFILVVLASIERTGYDNTDSVAVMAIIVG